jgi:hypothetical protein
MFLRSPRDGYPLAFGAQANSRALRDEDAKRGSRGVRGGIKIKIRIRIGIRGGGNTRDRSRTCDLRFRKPALYPTELRGLDI